jgi:proline dehydrogenase
VKRLLEPLALPVIRYATRSYVAGDTAGDAVQLAKLASKNGFACTLCYWNDGKEDPEIVAQQYRAAVDGLCAAELDGALAIKTPALWDRAETAARLVDYARARSVRAVFDAHAPAQADDVFRTIDLCGPDGVGLAIPARWKRSRADAERAIDLGVAVRIVKGQWPDQPETGIDIRAAYLELAAQLAGRARHVGVATHEASLSEAALKELLSQSTPCEQELIYPDPMAKAIQVSIDLDVTSRLYIPFGSAWLPYSLSRAVQKPEVMLWLVRDVFTSRQFKMPAKGPPRHNTAQQTA